MAAMKRKVWRSRRTSGAELWEGQTPVPGSRSEDKTC